MTATSPPVRLDRTLRSRLRPWGFIESCSYLMLFAVFLSVREIIRSGTWNPGQDIPVLVALIVLATVIRVAVWTEFAEATEEGIRWRALFRTEQYRWRHVESFGVAQLKLFPSRGWGMDVVEIRFTNGVTRRLRCSVSCARTRQRWLDDVAALRPAP